MCGQDDNILFGHRPIYDPSTDPWCIEVKLQQTQDGFTKMMRLVMPM